MMTDVLSREQIEEFRAKIVEFKVRPWQERDQKVAELHEQSLQFTLNALCDMALSAIDNAEDAERYRWLRENNEQHCDEELPYVTVNAQDTWGKWYSKFLTPEELDAAIDAARKEATK